MYQLWIPFRLDLQAKSVFYFCLNVFSYLYTIYIIYLSLLRLKNWECNKNVRENVLHNLASLFSKAGILFSGVFDRLNSVAEIRVRISTSFFRATGSLLLFNANLFRYFGNLKTIKKESRSIIVSYVEQSEYLSSS